MKFVAQLDGHETEPESLPAVPTSEKQHRNRKSVKLDLAREAAIEIWPPQGVAPRSFSEDRIHQQILNQLRKRPDLKKHTDGELPGKYTCSRAAGKRKMPDKASKAFKAMP